MSTSVAILTSVAGKSSDMLKADLQKAGFKCAVFRTKVNKKYDFRDWDVLFSYGCSRETLHNRRINSAEGVRNCIDKATTFRALATAGVPIPRWWTEKAAIPVEEIYDLVIRKDRKGRKAEDLLWWNWEEGVDTIPDGQLYTEYFEHRYEYRVTVFNGVVFVYHKKLHDDGYHWFMPQKIEKYPDMVQACVTAQVALGVDYVSFDVVANSRKDFVILEANSGTLYTEEAGAEIIKFLQS